MPEWTWEQWQWRGTLHSPKLQHYWNLTIRLFSVISRTIIAILAEKQSVYSMAPAKMPVQKVSCLNFNHIECCLHFPMTLSCHTIEINIIKLMTLRSHSVSCCQSILFKSYIIELSRCSWCNGYHIAGNGHDNSSSNLGQGSLHFT